MLRTAALPLPRRAVAVAVALVAALLLGLQPGSPAHAQEAAEDGAQSLLDLLVLAPAGLQPLDERPAPEDIPADPPAVAPEDVVEDEQAAEPLVFAEADGTALVLPGDVRAIGFHQGPKNGIPLIPTGALQEHLNVYRDAPRSTGATDLPYYVLPTRNRGTGASTAVDLSMRHGEPVASPVTGTVTTVQRYSLYGTTPDVLVEIEPEGRPDQLVRVLHVEGVQVAAGDDVAAGDPLADSGRQLPFPSQIDRIAGAYPHVHIEVQTR